MPGIEDLERYVGLLEETYNATFEQIKTEIDQDPHLTGVHPEQMRDVNGRFILLDALSAIVEARSILADRKAEPRFNIMIEMDPAATPADREKIGRAVHDALTKWKRETGA